jgi:hypothetical protein
MSKPKPMVDDLLTQLTPEHALVSLFDSDVSPIPVEDPAELARIVVQWLRDSGFAIVDAQGATPGLLAKLRAWREANPDGTKEEGRRALWQDLTEEDLAELQLFDRLSRKPPRH